MAIRDLPGENAPHKGEQVSRGGLHLVGLAAVTAVVVYLLYLLSTPFLPAIAWSLALAIVSYPIHAWIRRGVKNDNLAATLSVIVVVLVIVVPSIFVAAEMAREAGTASTLIREQLENGRVREAVLRMPYGDQIVPWVEQNANVRQLAEELTTLVARDTSALMRGSLWAALEIIVALFILFFCFRDRERLLRGVRAVVPLPFEETEEAFRRIADSIHATIYGTVVTALVQGISGGLLFWALGLPAPVLWGVVMTILGILPIVGAVLVWAPATALLIAEDRYGAAAILVVWGLLMAGPVGNYLYAGLVGDRLRMHPVPALLAYLGGLAVFGVTGMILGPVILTIAFELIEVWRRRTSPPDASSQRAATVDPINGEVSETVSV